jgi:hypothetical protein
MKAAIDVDLMNVYTYPKPTAIFAGCYSPPYNQSAEHNINLERSSYSHIRIPYAISTFGQ